MGAVGVTIPLTSTASKTKLVDWTEARNPRMWGVARPAANADVNAAVSAGLPEGDYWLYQASPLLRLPHRPHRGRTYHSRAVAACGPPLKEREPCPEQRVGLPASPSVTQRFDQLADRRRARRALLPRHVHPTGQPGCEAGLKQVNPVHDGTRRPPNPLRGASSVVEIRCSSTNRSTPTTSAASRRRARAVA